MSENEFEEIQLSELIEKVKADLRPQDSPDYPLFLVEKVELELHVSISKTKKGGVGISILNMISAKADEERLKENSNKITVTLTPILDRKEIQDALGLGERQKDEIARQFVKSGDN